MNESDGASPAWMDAAFAVYDPYQDTDFCLMDIDMDAQGCQQQQEQEQPPPLVPSTVMLDIDMLSAFLSEMEQLEEDKDALPNASDAHREGQHKKDLVASTAGATSNTQGSTKQKLSSSQRVSRDRLMLEETISKLQQEVERLSEAHQEKFPHVRERWRPIIRQERNKLKSATAARRQLHQAVVTQWKKATRLHDMLQQWSELMLVRCSHVTQT